MTSATPSLSPYPLPERVTTDAAVTLWEALEAGAAGVDASAVEFLGLAGFQALLRASHDRGEPLHALIPHQSTAFRAACSRFGADTAFSALPKEPPL